MVSYEIPLAICALIPVVAAGSLNLGEIGTMQTGWFGNWFLFHDPFTFLAFFVYFTVATAGVKRAPFDLAEAESELVGGFHTEYSGMRWSFFFMAEYGSMLLVSCLAGVLFLGAWHTGIGPLDALLQGWRASAGDSFYPLSYLANLIGMVVVIVKGSALVFFQIWLRWTLPRLRIDQVMMTCLKYLIPISCFLFLGAILWPLLLVSVTDSIPGVKPRTHWAKPLGEKQRGVRRDTDAETRRRGDAGTSPEIAASHSAFQEGGNR
jgi:NADH-quinone oxidoreductase subunit H